MTYTTHAIRRDGRKYTRKDHTYHDCIKSYRWARQSRHFVEVYSLREDGSTVRPRPYEYPNRHEDLPAPEVRGEWRWNEPLSPNHSSRIETADYLADMREAAMEYFENVMVDPYYPDDRSLQDAVAGALDDLPDQWDAFGAEQMDNLIDTTRWWAKTGWSWVSTHGDDPLRRLGSHLAPRPVQWTHPLFGGMVNLCVGFAHDHRRSQKGLKMFEKITATCRTATYKMGERLMSLSMSGTYLEDVLALVLGKDGIINRVNQSIVACRDETEQGGTDEIVHSLSVRYTNYGGLHHGAVAHETMTPVWSPVMAFMARLGPLERTAAISQLGAIVLAAHVHCDDDERLGKMVRANANELLVAMGVRPKPSSGAANTLH